MAGLRRVMTNSCATVGKTKKKTGEGKREFVISCICGTEPRASHSSGERTLQFWRLRQMHLSFQGWHVAKRIALERMVRQWVWKSANTGALGDSLLTSRSMTSSVGWTASFNSSRFRLSAAFQTVWAGCCEGCSPSIRPQSTSRGTKKNKYEDLRGLVQVWI